jgi:phosphoglucosamine mutase
MSKFPQTMINVALPQKIDIDGNQEINGAVTAAEQQLNGRGRVLLRPSGTEPVVRVMVEGEDNALVNQLAAELAKTVEQQVGA